jgi:hypothetical protein
MTTTSYPSKAYNDEDIQLTSELTHLYTIARAKKRRMYSVWRKNYLLLCNRAWSDFRASSWMPSPTDSEIYPIISSVAGWMTDQEVKATISAAADPQTAYAKYLDKIALDLQNVYNANWTSLNFDRQVNLAIIDASLYGSGIFKSVWDSGYDEGMGQALLQRVDPWAIYPDPNATSLEDMAFLIEVRRMSYDEIERRFPLAFDAVKANAQALQQGTSGDTDIRPQLNDAEQYPKTNLGWTSGPGSSSAPGGGPYGLPGQSRRHITQTAGILVYEVWMRENKVTDIKDTPQGEQPNDELQYPTKIITDSWRVVLHAANVVLLDEYADDLWTSGRHPYSKFEFDDIGEFWGMPMVSHLAPAQVAINRLLSSVQQNAELCGNPIFLESASSGLSRTTIVNKPGSRLIMDGNQSGQVTPPSWLTPPTIPQFIQDLIKFWIERMENISGLAQISKGKQPAARTPASTTASVQESGFVRVRRALRNLQFALREAAQLQCELICENYTTPRIVSIVGESGEPTSLALAARHFYDPNREGAQPFKYALQIDCGANNPTSRSARIAESDTLFAMQAIDRKAVLDAHNFPGREEIQSRMAEAEQQAAMFGGHPSGGGGAGKRVRAQRQT